MQAILKTKPSTPALLYSVTRAGFSTNTLTYSLNPNRNHQLRVMSTPQFPVPYYQRMFRDIPKHSDMKVDLSNVQQEPTDLDVLHAKEALRAKGKGYIVEAVENHFPLKNYVTKFEDSGEFSKAYVDDLLEALDLVHNQNKDLLGKHDLGACLE